MRVLKRLSGVMAALLAMLLMAGSASAATMDGYDVSNFQSETVARDAPGDFAIMEVTEGGFVVNPQWNTQTQYALANGKQIGLYHYAGGGVPEAEAVDYTVLLLSCHTPIPLCFRTGWRLAEQWRELWTLGLLRLRPLIQLS